VTDEVESLCAAGYLIGPLRHLDARWSPVKTTGASAYQYRAQICAKFVTSNPIQPWINKCVWNLFSGGNFQRIDGRTLGVGVVRDSTLNATNDLSCSPRSLRQSPCGVWALTVIRRWLPNGGSAGTVVTTAYTGA
jgi:hypothetical protein